MIHSIQGQGCAIGINRHELTQGAKTTRSDRRQHVDRRVPIAPVEIALPEVAF
jgi:hypothetical protein